MAGGFLNNTATIRLDVDTAKARASIGQLGSRFQQFNRQTKSGLIVTQKGLDTLRTSTAKAGTQISRTATTSTRGLSRIRDGVTSLGSKFNSVFSAILGRSGLSGFSSSLNGVALGITAITALGIKLGSSFVTAFSGIQSGLLRSLTLVDRNVNSYGDLENAVDKVSEKYNIKRSDISDRALFDTLSATIGNVPEAEVSLERAAEISRVSNVPLAEIAGLFAANQRVTGFGSDDFGDYLQQVSRYSLANSAQVLKTLPKIFPLSKELSIPHEQIGALFATFTQSGLAIADTQTAIVGIVRQLGRSSSDLNKQIRKVTGFGLEENILQGKTLGEILSVSLVDDAGNPLSTEDINALTGRVRAGIGIGTLQGNPKLFERILNEIHNREGALTEAVGVATQDFSSTDDKLRELSISIENLQQSLGVSLVDSGLVDALVGFGENISKSGIPEIAGAIANGINLGLTPFFKGTELLLDAATFFVKKGDFNIAEKIQEIEDRGNVALNAGPFGVLEISGVSALTKAGILTAEQQAIKEGLFEGSPPYASDIPANNKYGYSLPQPSKLPTGFPGVSIIPSAIPFREPTTPPFASDYDRYEYLKFYRANLPIDQYNGLFQGQNGVDEYDLIEARTQIYLARIADATEGTEDGVNKTDFSPSNITATEIVISAGRGNSGRTLKENLLVE